MRVRARARARVREPLREERDAKVERAEPPREWHRRPEDEHESEHAPG